MTGLTPRYPGIQPFRQDSLAQKTFFGRSRETRLLANMILSNRLVVLYARSGIGKTSLLNAGVSPLLREESFIPLIVRLNDQSVSPLISIYNQLQALTLKLEVEYHKGLEYSLWHYFKTVEFWYQDNLLTPVLILDQFEELFTLHPIRVQDLFLAELGYLIRGERPWRGKSLRSHLQSSDQDQVPINDSSPPPVHILISIREDFLSCLEDASDRIPQILDQRFRLLPLTQSTTKEALEGPSTVAGNNFTSQPFVIDAECSYQIVTFLSQSALKKSTLQQFSAYAISRRSWVDPCQLQLICQEIEKIAIQKQGLSQTRVVITLDEIGGETGLAAILKSFYTDALRICSRRPDLFGFSRVIKEALLLRRLSFFCEQYMISPQGRRLSVDEDKIWHDTHLPAEILSKLVNCRILRTDQRSDTLYYELSHDTLVNVILGSSKIKQWARACIAFGGIVVTTYLLLAYLILAVYIVMSAFDIDPGVERSIVATIKVLGLKFAIYGMPIIGLAIFVLFYGLLSLRKLPRV